MNRKQKFFEIILISGVASLGFFAFTVVARPTQAFAATFTVDSTADDSDTANGDGDCVTTEDECTLRAAMQEANELDGVDIIEFNIPGAGLHTITPSTGLPGFGDESLTIDASTQPGASCGTLVPSELPVDNDPHTLLIELNAEDMQVPAISMHADGDEVEHTLRGFVINRADPSFSDYSIYVSGNAGVSTLDCNYIGTNAGGTANTNNNGYGVHALGAIVVTNNLISGFNTGVVTLSDAIVTGNLIGTDATGTQALSNQTGARIEGPGGEFTHNIVAGNTADGVIVANNGLNFMSNYVGVSVDGNPLGNGEDGVEFTSGANGYFAGSEDTSSRNIISSNGQSGIHLYNLIGDLCATDNINSEIFGNYIGTDTNGEVSDGYGNGGSGIEVNEQGDGECGDGSVYNHQIGGVEDGQSNTIAGNADDGVRAYDSGGDTDVFGVTIIRNSIHSNGGLAIDLATDPESNGEATDDLGPNPLNDLLLEYPSASANNYLNAPTVDYFSLEDGTVNAHYNFSAPEVLESGDGVSLLSSDLVGYRLDFYINAEVTDGAYNGYSQAQNYLGGFIVDGNESDAVHKFTNSINVTEDSVITATATVLWRIIEEPFCVDGERFGVGPPYQLSQDTCD